MLKCHDDGEFGHWCLGLANVMASFAKLFDLFVCVEVYQMQCSYYGIVNRDEIDCVYVEGV